MTVTKNQIVTWLEKTADVLIQNKEYLTELDSAIGDADHGINMDRGFRKVNEKLPSVADKDIGSILKTMGMTLISSVGGAAGPLYGTFYMRSGMAVAAKEELNNGDVVEMLQAGVDGIVQRGRAELRGQDHVRCLGAGDGGPQCQFTGKRRSDRRHHRVRRGRGTRHERYDSVAGAEGPGQLPG